VGRSYRHSTMRAGLTSSHDDKTQRPSPRAARSRRASSSRQNSRRCRIGLAAHRKIPNHRAAAPFLPALNVPEIAFVGRSNAGKSTCINTLTQQRQLAFASKKPGRTQHINLFSLGKQGITDAVLTDLPGYGYAAVPQQDKIRWQQVMANYLVTREEPAQESCCCATPGSAYRARRDVARRDSAPGATGPEVLVVLTKADKLTRAEATKALSITKLQAGGGEVMLFSATKRTGVGEVAELLWKWAHPTSGALPAPVAEIPSAPAAP